MAPLHIGTRSKKAPWWDRVSAIAVVTRVEPKLSFSLSPPARSPSSLDRWRGSTFSYKDGYCGTERKRDQYSRNAK